MSSNKNSQQIKRLTTPGNQSFLESPTPLFRRLAGIKLDELVLR